ncbi:MAG: aminotransferase class IV [Nitrospinota bacterium]
MSTRARLPVLQPEEVVERLRAAAHPQSGNFYAMYSSVLGGIVTDPAFMVLPIDDHMVHRGHAVFDTAMIVDGKVYQLDPHLDRFLRSAEGARIPLPFPRERMRELILETCAASRQRDASVRYWLSVGPGGFALGVGECIGSSLYVMVFKGVDYEERYYTEGMRVVTSTVPIKPPLFARTKSNNYLTNALLLIEANDKGADNGIFVDARGCVGESSHMNIAFVSQDGVLRHPKFDAILSGITVLRLLELARGLIPKGLIRDVRVEDIPVEGAKRSREAFLIGSSIAVAPVVEWDGAPIGDGKPGPVALALRELLEEDKRSGEGQLIPLEYPD